jgi:hypothetical protein
MTFHGSIYTHVHTRGNERVVARSVGVADASAINTLHAYWRVYFRTHARGWDCVDDRVLDRVHDRTIEEINR